MCEREGERESGCVRERERESGCVRERERDSECVRERVGGRERAEHLEITNFDSIHDTSHRCHMSWETSCNTFLTR